MKLLVATRSRGKQREFRGLLAPLGATIVFPDDIGLAETVAEASLEIGDSFVANARAKAWWFAHLSELPTLSDDSGLEVDALGGAPGVHSKRFSGTDGPDHDVTSANNSALVSALAGVPSAERSARYRCVLVLARPSDAIDWPFAPPMAGGEIIAEGSVAGSILAEARGRGGFGYDPLFYCEELGHSFGEAAPEDKARVSHRGRAVAELIRMLQESPR